MRNITERAGQIKKHYITIFWWPLKKTQARYLMKNAKSCFRLHLIGFNATNVCEFVPFSSIMFFPDNMIENAIEIHL